MIYLTLLNNDCISTINDDYHMIDSVRYFLSRAVQPNKMQDDPINLSITQLDLNDRIRSIDSVRQSFYLLCSF